MKIDEKMNGGPLPYDKSTCPACLRKYRFVLGLGDKLPTGGYMCHAWSPQEKPKNPVQSFILDPDAAPESYKVLFTAHSCSHLSQHTISSPLDCLFGSELQDKLAEMYTEGYAAWN